MKMIKTAGKPRTRTHEESQLQRDCVAWFRIGSSGCAHYYYMYGSYLALPLLLYTFRESEQ